MNKPTDALAGPLHCVVSLRIVPIDHKGANAFVKKYHRHHKPTVGHKFSLAIADETDAIRGVAIVGRPVARMLDDGWTLEVNRCCTDGVRNGCSMLYGKAWQVAKALGYRKLITYTLPAEGGASLRGAGWKCIGERGGATGTSSRGHGWTPTFCYRGRNYFGKQEIGRAHV